VTAEDITTAARALAAGGFVTGPAATLARRHRRELSTLFREELGWQIIAEDHGAVRALCQPGAGHVQRGLAAQSGREFDPQRYALTFLVLAALEAAGARTTLTVLFADVRDRAGDIEGLDFDHNQASHRRAFVHAVQAVTALGVLELADGAEETFARSGEGDALYRVVRTQLTRVLATSKPPSLAARPSDAVAENLYSDTDAARTRLRKHRITRALVAEPVLYRDDLTEDELAYFAGQEKRIRKLLAERFGLVLETRAEGWVAVDPDGSLTDQRFPAISTARAAGLAIVDASRTRRSDGDTEVSWTTGELHEFNAGLGDQFGASWTVDAADPDAVARVTEDAVGVLVAMRLARREADGVAVLAAAGRFAVSTADEPTVPTPPLIDFEAAAP
jgi:uncharacterized protein (TIGR02678 family)